MDGHFFWSHIYPMGYLLVLNEPTTFGRLD